MQALAPQPAIPCIGVWRDPLFASGVHHHQRDLHSPAAVVIQPVATAEAHRGSGCPESSGRVPGSIWRGSWSLFGPRSSRMLNRSITHFVRQPAPPMDLDNEAAVFAALHIHRDRQEPHASGDWRRFAAVFGPGPSGVHRCADSPHGDEGKAAPQSVLMMVLSVSWLAGSGANCLFGGCQLCGQAAPGSGRPLRGPPSRTDAIRVSRRCPCSSPSPSAIQHPRAPTAHPD